MDSEGETGMSEVKLEIDIAEDPSLDWQDCESGKCHSEVILGCLPPLKTVSQWGYSWLSITPVDSITVRLLLVVYYPCEQYSEVVLGCLLPL